MSRSKAERVGRETVPGKMKQRLAPGHGARNHHTTPTRTQDMKKAMARVRMGVKGLLLLNWVRVCSVSESGQGGTAVLRARVEPHLKKPGSGQKAARGRTSGNLFDVFTA